MPTVESTSKTRSHNILVSRFSAQDFAPWFLRALKLAVCCYHIEGIWDLLWPEDKVAWSQLCHAGVQELSVWESTGAEASSEFESRFLLFPLSGRGSRAQLNLEPCRKLMGYIFFCRHWSGWMRSIGASRPAGEQPPFLPHIDPPGSSKGHLNPQERHHLFC